MGLRVNRSDSLPAAVIACILSLLATSTARSAGPLDFSSPAASEASVVVVATLYTVDTRDRRIELITGTGLALRLMRMDVHSSCEITVSGAGAAIDDLKAGRVVRVEYRSEAGRKVASKIETLRVGTGVTTP